MKKILIILCIGFLFTSCADNKVIDNVEYRPYGLLNEDSCKNDSIQYSVSTGSVIVGVIFCESVIVPIYVFGFNLWEPIGIKGKVIKGAIQ